MSPVLAEYFFNRVSFVSSLTFFETSILPLFFVVYFDILVLDVRLQYI